MMVLLFLLALLVPTSASAEAPPGPVMQFRLPASNGYALRVKTERGGTQVSLLGSHPRVSATYYVNETVGEGIIDADIGPLGHVDVRFEPSGATKTVAVHGCRLRRRLGAFIGTISFRGEGGYASVEATQAWGSIGPSVLGRCGSRRGRAGGPPEPPSGVERVWILGNASLVNHSPFSAETSSATYFAALTEGAVARYLVDRVEMPGPGLAIVRSADVPAPRSTFTYSGDLSSATLQPPAPFSGEAVYSGRRQRLSGDLAVELPGLGPQPLTGPSFETQINGIR